ncbi:MAG: 50S ribosomal protein L17 [Myxococcales bacterium]|nr:50S ribosomal protein L17 [Myxococcales bacterium]
MRHQSKSRRFGRDTEHRLSMFANLVTSLLVHERVLTTLARAKELRRVAEKIITLGKRGTLAARRLAAQRLNTQGEWVGNPKRLVQSDKALEKLFGTIAPRFKDRPGGYTRIVRTGFRHGDNAPMAFLELIPAETPKPEGGKKPAAKKPGAKAPAKGAKPGAKTAAKTAAKKPAAKKPAAKKPAEGDDK